VLRCVLRSGARAALPGEFTKRAFMNGRMDLTQAEAVCDYIGARSQEGARACARQMQGALKREVTTCQDRLTDVIARVEAAVEYPEEDLEPLVLETALPVVSGLAETVSALEKSYRAGRVLKEGLRVTIAGRPNVGKSSLLNVLTGVDRAIVSGLPGTTRDTIEQCYAEDGIEIIVTDTAGIRDTADAVEAQGVRRSKDAVDDADLVLFLRDSQTGMRREDAPVLERLKARADAVIPVWNKIDVSERLPDAGETDTWFAREPAYISAKTGQGIDALKKRIRAFAGAEEREGVVITSERHREILCRAAACLRDAENALREGLDMDCVTIDLRAAWSALGEMTGSTAGEAIIDRIFEKFCLGK
jgi:tRNA modification GTPase